MRPNLRALRLLTVLIGRILAGFRCVSFPLATGFVVLAAIASSINISFADENGTSFWIPGFFGSLAATPQQPGWSLTSILYNTNVSASGNAAVSREITIGDLPKTTVKISGSANVHADAIIGFLAPTYVFATPFLGGQASATLLFGLWQQRYIIERVGNCYCAFTSCLYHQIHRAPARHDGFYRCNSNIR